MTIEEIKAAIMADARNAAYTDRGIGPVFQISPQARVLLIGQAPGRKVEETGIPFNDASGATLMDWLGVSREIFYSPSIAIMPMDFYYPGKGKSGDLPPRRFMAQEYHPALRALMPDVRLTVLIGSYAVNAYLHETKKRTLTETVQAYEDYLPDIFPIVHPSPLNFRWQKKNPWFLTEVVPALRQCAAQALTDPS